MSRHRSVRRAPQRCSVALLLIGAVLVPACGTPSHTRVEREDILVLTKRMVALDEAGRYEEALPLAQRAAEYAEDALGPEHPTVAVYLTYLAGVYRSLGETSGARALYEHVLAMQERQLGPDHMAVSNTLTAVAGLYQELGGPERAASSLRRALAIREQALGRGHPATVAVVSQLAIQYEAMGAHDRAESLLLRALAFPGYADGRPHPTRAETLRSYARLLRKTNRLLEAEEIEARIHALPQGSD